MKNSFKFLLAFISFTVVNTESVHDDGPPGELYSHHEHAHGIQIPLNYVKYPWLSPNSHSTYPGNNDDGKHTEGRPITFVLFFDGFRLAPLFFFFFSVTADSIFSGITTFARLPWQDCLSPTSTLGKTPADIVFIGAPFDTGTSYRPGARFGPNGIRAGSRRTFLYGSYNVPMSHNPLRSGLR